MQKSEKKFKTKLQKLLGTTDLTTLTILDVEDKYYDTGELTQDEKKALRNYQRYRVRRLRNSKSPDRFNKNYTRIQVLSNLAEYTEFLKAKYDN